MSTEGNIATELLPLVRPNTSTWDVNKKHKLTQNSTFLNPACQTVFVCNILAKFDVVCKNLSDMRICVASTLLTLCVVQTQTRTNWGHIPLQSTKGQKLLTLVCWCINAVMLLFHSLECLNTTSMQLPAEAELLSMQSSGCYLLFLLVCAVLKSLRFWNAHI